MKYLGILFLVLSTTWTWSVVHCEAKMPFETHAAIQEKLSEVLISAIASKKPSATEITTEKLWTELMSEGQIKAHFTYSFKEVDSTGETITTRISGLGFLDKQVGEIENWTLTKIKTDSDSIVFENGVVISSGKDESTQ